MESILSGGAGGIVDGDIDSQTLLIIFVIVLASVIGFMILIKIFYWVRYRKIYYIFPKIDTRGISNSAMVIAISISIILLLTVLSAGVMGVFFRMYPGWRVTIEGILIKIGGLLFGPIIGIFIGGITDILTVALTAGMFHYGFFVIAMIYGFMAGIVKVIFNFCKGNSFLFFILSSVISILVTFGIDWYVLSKFPVYNFSLLSLNVEFTNWMLVTIISCIQGGVLLILIAVSVFFQFKRFKVGYYNFILFFIYDVRKKFYINRLRSGGKHCQKYANKLLLLDISIQQKTIGKMLNRRNVLEKAINEHGANRWFNPLSLVILLITFVEPIIEIIIMPIFDQEMGGGIPLEFWIPFRVFFSIPIIIANFCVVFPVYKTIMPFMRYDYRTNISEYAVLKKK